MVRKNPKVRKVTISETAVKKDADAQHKVRVYIRYKVCFEEVAAIDYIRAWLQARINPETGVFYACAGSWTKQKKAADAAPRPQKRLRVPGPQSAKGAIPANAPLPRLECGSTGGARTAAVATGLDGDWDVFRSALTQLVTDNNAPVENAEAVELSGAIGLAPASPGASGASAELAPSGAGHGATAGSEEWDPLPEMEEWAQDLGLEEDDAVFVPELFEPMSPAQPSPEGCGSQELVGDLASAGDWRLVADALVLAPGVSIAGATESQQQTTNAAAAIAAPQRVLGARFDRPASLDAAKRKRTESLDAVDTMGGGSCSVLAAMGLPNRADVLRPQHWAKDVLKEASLVNAQHNRSHAPDAAPTTAAPPTGTTPYPVPYPKRGGPGGFFLERGRSLMGYFSKSDAPEDSSAAHEAFARQAVADMETDFGVGAAAVLGRHGCMFENKGVAKLLGMSLRACWSQQWPGHGPPMVFSVADLPRIMYASSSLFLRGTGSTVTIDSIQIYPFSGDPPWQARLHLRRVAVPDGASFNILTLVPHLGVAAIMAARKQGAAADRDGASEAP